MFKNDEQNTLNKDDELIIIDFIKDKFHAFNLKTAYVINKLRVEFTIDDKKLATDICFKLLKNP